MPLSLLLLLALAGTVSAQIKIAILMQGSDFINVSIVPTFDVDQFDLGDVYISPCRAGTYNEARDSYCKDCTICAANQFEHLECIATRNRVCHNCTVCSDREQQICQCRERSPNCVTGDSVCLPLPPTTANITFDMTVSAPLSVLRERFLQEGLRTGFVLFLAEYLQHSADSIVFLFLRKNTPLTYTTTFLINDVYSLFTKRQVAGMTQEVVQVGLTSTFGVQSNTFSTTVTGQRRRLILRRRLLQQTNIIINLFAGNVETQCVNQGACGRFFVMSHPDSPCESTCVSLPCPPGYTGIYGICELCPNATYKPLEGNASCTPCPLQGATSDQGSVDVSQCFVPATHGPTTTATTTLGATPATTTPLEPGQTVDGRNPNQTSPQASTPLSVTTASAAPSPTTSVLPSIARTTTTLLQTTSAATPTPTAAQTPAPPPPPSGGGGGGSTGGGGGLLLNGLLNLTLLQQQFYNFTTVQYIVIRNNNNNNFYYMEEDPFLGRWGMTIAGFVLTASFMWLAVIGLRLSAPAAHAPASTRKREIALPVVRPPSSPAHHEHHDTSDSEDSSKGHPPSRAPPPADRNRPHHDHILIPKGVFLSSGGGQQQQRRRSRSADAA